VRIRAKDLVEHEAALDNRSPRPQRCAPTEPGEDTRRKAVLALLRLHGWNATSFQVLEQGFSHWFDPDVDACVACAGLSILEVFADAGQRARGPVDGALLAVGCIGPMLATALLWSALGRRRRVSVR
jgi:hypothetical protein